MITLGMLGMWHTDAACDRELLERWKNQGFERSIVSIISTESDENQGLACTARYAGSVQKDVV